MIQLCSNAAEAVAEIPDGATVLVGGFGTAGQPVELIDALIDIGRHRPHRRQQQRRQRRRRPRRPDPERPRAQDHLLASRGSPTPGTSTRPTAPGEIELELVPQGNLAERIRAAGAGIGGFFTPTGYGTPLAEGKEVREIDGRHYVLELPVRGRLRAGQGATSRTRPATSSTARRPATSARSWPRPPRTHDRPGRRGGAAAAALDPENVVTPGIYVDRVVAVPRATTPELEDGQ